MGERHGRVVPEALSMETGDWKTEGDDGSCKLAM